MERVATPTPGAFNAWADACLIALDGTEHFCSRKIRWSNAPTEPLRWWHRHFHALLARLVAPATEGPAARPNSSPPRWRENRNASETPDKTAGPGKHVLPWRATAIDLGPHGEPVRTTDLFAFQPIVTAIRKERRQLHPDLPSQLAPDHRR